MVCSTRESRGSPDATVTSTFMLDRPVLTIRARASTRWPTCTGRVKLTLPTYAVTQYLPLHPTAQA